MGQKGLSRGRGGRWRRIGVEMLQEQEFIVSAFTRTHERPDRPGRKRKKHTALDGVRGLRWNMVPGPTSLATTTTRGHLLRARQWRRVDPEPWSQHDWR